VSDWPNFEQYVEDLIKQVKDQYIDCVKNCANPSDYANTSVQKNSVTRAAFHSKEFVLAYKDHRWSDPSNVCNDWRLWLLIVELEKRGFGCDLLQTECRATDGIVLRVGLDFDASINAPSASVVQLAGIKVCNGRLQVCSSAHYSCRHGHIEEEFP
jgi:hypothetical protein